MIVSSGIGILYPDQLQIMVPADFILFSVPFPDNGILKMLLSVQLDGQYRNLLSVQLLIYYKIKSPALKQVAVCIIVLKYL